jgi:hypothetical protein
MCLRKIGGDASADAQLQGDLDRLRTAPVNPEENSSGTENHL